MTADMNWKQGLPNIVKMRYWVNKPVTNTTQSDLKIATNMQLLWPSSSHVLSPIAATQQLTEIVFLHVILQV